MRRRRTAGVGIFGIAILAMSVGMSSAGETGARVSVPGGAYTNVTVATLKEMLTRKDFVFVNVHIPYEGEVAPTDTFLPFNDIDQQIGRLPFKKDAKVVLYCMSDRMSTIAAEKLVQLGYTNIWNLEGGMVAWKAKGYPLMQQERR